jgi:energy-coupling factor transporter transmembrane protein EcfT
MLAFLSIAHTSASSRLLMPLILFTLSICALHRRSLLRGAWIIAATAVALAAFALMVRLTGYSVPWTELGIGYLRVLSLSTVSVVLVLSMNSLQVITSLSFFRLPLGIALAAGVGLRFLPVFVEEARRIRIMQRHRISITSKSVGLVGRLDQTISPFIVSVLRRVDLLLLSIAVQQLEHRIKTYVTPRLRVRDLIAMVATGLLLIASVIL